MSYLFDKGRQAFGNGDISWESDNIKAILVDAADYTPDSANDEFLEDIPVGARVATSANLATKTNIGGVLDAADLTLSTVTGDESEYIVLFQDLASESTSRLIGLIDSATGLPVTPNGADIVIQWDNGVNKILKL